jgi:hypothetical protein
MGATMALASVVKNPNSSGSPSTGALFGPRAPRQRLNLDEMLLTPQLADRHAPPKG